MHMFWNLLGFPYRKLLFKFARRGKSSRKTLVGRATASPSSKHSISLKPTTIPGLRLVFANVPRKCVPRKMQCTAQCLSRTFQLVVPREERDRSLAAPSLSMQTCVLRGSDTSNMSTLVCMCARGVILDSVQTLSLWAKAHVHRVVCS